jgi:hypothetical protein
VLHVRLVPGRGIDARHEEGTAAVHFGERLDRLRGPCGIARARIEGEDEPGSTSTLKAHGDARAHTSDEAERRLRGPHLEWAVCSAVGTLEQ